MKIIDLHNDFLTCLKINEIEKYIKSCEKDGVVCLLASIWTTRIKDPLKFIKKILNKLQQISSNVKIKVHIEDSWFLNETNIEEFLDLGIFSVGLTWNYDNSLAGGINGKSGLTRLGKKMLKKLSEKNIILDTAHLNRKSFYQVFKFFKGKIFCTHTAFSKINKHARNLSNKQCEKIIKNGGVIGLCFVPDFLKGEGTNIRDVVKHIKWFVKNFGENSLCIGTDFFGVEKLPEKLKSYGDFKNLIWEMKRQGISKVCIQKIFYQNALKFIM